MGITWRVIYLKPEQWEQFLMVKKKYLQLYPDRAMFSVPNHEICVSAFNVYLGGDYYLNPRKR